jgi:hypothetical protein
MWRLNPSSHMITRIAAIVKSNWASYGDVDRLATELNAGDAERSRLGPWGDVYDFEMSAAP